MFWTCRCETIVRHLVKTKFNKLASSNNIQLLLDCLQSRFCRFLYVFLWVSPRIEVSDWLNKNTETKRQKHHRLLYPTKGLFKNIFISLQYFVISHSLLSNTPFPCIKLIFSRMISLSIKLFYFSFTIIFFYLIL